MNRVTQYSVTNISGTLTKTMVYNEIGDILSKSDVGTYTYGNTGAARPHAVASISGLLNTSYTYDLNGNMTSGAGKTTTWTAANMVATIVEGTNTVSFLYGSDNQRIKQTDSRGDTFYYTGAGIKVEKLVNGGQTTVSDVHPPPVILLGTLRLCPLMHFVREFVHGSLNVVSQ